MKNTQWDGELQTGHQEIDHHHEDLFALDRMVEEAIRRNDRGELEKIVLFLEAYVVDHFESEEVLMSENQFSGYDEHKAEHEYFREKVAEIRLIYDEGTHNTHLVYKIRQLIDSLIHHIRTIDIKLAAL